MKISLAALWALSVSSAFAQTAPSAVNAVEILDQTATEAHLLVKDPSPEVIAAVESAAAVDREQTKNVKRVHEIQDQVDGEAAFHMANAIADDNVRLEKERFRALETALASVPALRGGAIAKARLIGGMVYVKIVPARLELRRERLAAIRGRERPLPIFVKDSEPIDICAAGDCR